MNLTQLLVALLTLGFVRPRSGTWTPTYLGRTTAGVTTYSGQPSGFWYRIGKLTFVHGYVAWSAATGTGQAAIGGLPFAAAYDAVLNMSYDNHVMGAGKQGVAYLGAGSNIGIYANDPAGGANASVAVDGAGSIRVTGVYWAA